VGIAFLQGRLRNKDAALQVVPVAVPTTPKLAAAAALRVQVS